MCKSVLHKSGHIKIGICLSIIVTLHLGKLPTHSSGLRNSDTVKLGDKEELGVKELFTDYQQLANKETLKNVWSDFGILH